VLLTAVCLLASGSAVLAQEAAQWERGQSGNVDFADLNLDRKARFTAFCRMTSTGPLAGLALSVPQFQTLLIDEQQYSLTIVIDGVRESFHMEARDVELWFEAKDLNQQTQLARFFDTLVTAGRVDFAISTLRWRENRIIANSAEIAGLMDKCL